MQICSFRNFFNKTYAINLLKSTSNTVFHLLCNIILKFTKTVFTANKWSSTYFCPDLSEGISFEDLEKVFISTVKINHKLSKTSLLPLPEWRRGHRCRKRRVSRRCDGAGDTWGCSAGWRTWDRGHTWMAAPCCGHDCVSGGRPSQRTAYHTPCTPHCGSVKHITYSLLYTVIFYLLHLLNGFALC